LRHPTASACENPWTCERARYAWAASIAAVAGVQSVRLMAGRRLLRTDNRTVVRFLRVDPQPPALMPLVAP